MIGELDAALHLAIQREVLGSAQLAFDDDRLSEIHDELGGRPALDWRRLEGLGALRAGRRDRLISFPHVSASFCARAPGASAIPDSTSGTFDGTEASPSSS